MLTKDRAADIFGRLRKFSAADELEAYFYGGCSALTRFANNVIHQNVAEENYGVSVRAALGGRTARASTNKLDDESLKRVVAASESLARVQQPDPDLLPVPTPQERDTANVSRLTLPSRHFAETASITPEDRAQGVKKIVGAADRHKPHHGGDLFKLGIGGRHLQLAWIGRLAHANFRRDLDHYVGEGFFRMAEGELARCAPS